ncbi:MAG TPA: peptidase, partial [Polyangia bacterium]|nr:peptidase [Polyangia bacterium]
GALGTNATCHQTTAAVQGIECGNFVAPRQLTANGQTITCTGNGMALPPPVNGGYCIQTTAGTYSFAYFGTY